MLKAFSIYDVKSDTFRTPFFMNSAPEAIRAFEDLVNDANTLVARHPEDFKLVCVGTFDEVKGVLAPAEHMSLGFAIDYRNPPLPVPVDLREVKHG